MTTCTLNFGFYGKVRGAKLCCPVSTEIPSVPLRGKKNKSVQTVKEESYIHIKNYMYEVTSVMGALSPCSSTACSRCTGFETLHSPSLSIEDPVIDHGPHTRKGIFPTVVKSFLRQGTRTTNGLFGIPEPPSGEPTSTQTSPTKGLHHKALICQVIFTLEAMYWLVCEISRKVPSHIKRTLYPGMLIAWMHITNFQHAPAVNFTR